ncbi:PREDICTED: uncharacterized protein LOC104567624 [Tinamus guttatus]|uniref:uncharacterized protein LOC104567624 n=1 Tax=Tinamus guttatus TaxID=94827 RepID=UPI00052EF35D|nr:PREDICTED: uncharacterized protein LOC104567624 [Tinamus guttatus]
MLPNAKISNIPLSEKKGLKSSSLAISSCFSDDLGKGLLYEPVNKQAGDPLPKSANAVSSILGSENAYFGIGSNTSGKTSFKKPECKEIQDLKSLLMQNVICEDSISSDTYDCHSNANFGSPHGLASPLGKLALDSGVSHPVNRRNELENLSLLKQDRKQESPSLAMAALPVSKSGGASLADLLQAHQESSATCCYSLADLYAQSTASLTDMKLGTSSLSQLVSQPQTSGVIPELTESLSSLALSKVSPVKDFESLSLSDLIAETIEVDKTQQGKDFMQSVTEVKPSKRAKIDLSSTIKKADTSVEQNARQDLTPSWVKALHARPSPFALTLCLCYPPKGYKRRVVGVHKAFLYSRQVQEVKPEETGPVVAITPFDFQSASPDDIVKAKQKKAFIRE